MTAMTTAAAAAAQDEDDDRQEPRFILYLRGEAHQAMLKSLAGWVHEILLPLYGREVTSSSPWCPRWWEHREAVARLHALFMAWHDLTSETEDRTGPAAWHRDHLSAAMEALNDPRGPFAGCKANRHQVKEVPHTDDFVPFAPPPRSAEPRTTPEFIFYLDSDYAPELHRLTVWVKDLVLPNYGLETTSDAPWCPQWWKHPEAVGQLHALWLAWEELTGWDTTLSGPSYWQRDYLGPALREVRDPGGPFAGCRPAHRAKTAPRVDPFPS